MDSHLHIRRRIFLCWHIWEFPRALLVWTWNLNIEILIRGGVHHFSRDLPCVPKQVMEKPRRRPSLAQTAMAGANNPPEIHFSLSLHKFSNYFFLEWISFNMMRLGRGSSLLRPLTEIQMQKKLQVRIRIISISFISSILTSRERKALTCRSQWYGVAPQAVGRKSWQSEGCRTWIFVQPLSAFVLTHSHLPCGSDKLRISFCPFSSSHLEYSLQLEPKP